MRKILLFLESLTMFSLIACSTIEMPDVSKGRQLILDGKAECVMMNNNEIIAVESGRGLSPLLRMYDKHKSQMKDAVIVDKVIGRAAASIAIYGKARYVYGEVMSEDAVEYLKEHKIDSGYTLLVPRILNRKRNGLCPLEKSVEGINDPDKALTALRTKIAELSKANKK